MNVYLLNKVKSGIIKNDDLGEGKEREKTTILGRINRIIF